MNRDTLKQIMIDQKKATSIIPLDSPEVFSRGECKLLFVGESEEPVNLI